MKFKKRTVHDEDQVAGRHGPGGRGFHGTTVMGFVYKGGVMLGADSRVVNPKTHKNTDGNHKIFIINKHVLAAGAGTTSTYTKSLKGLRTSNTNLKEARDAAKELAKMCRSDDDVEFLTGSFVRNQGELCHVDPKNKVTVYSNKGDNWREKRKEGIDRWFMAIGTGKEFAEKVLDDGYDFNFDDQSACQLAFKAVQAGIKHDSIYSGGRPIVYRIGEKGHEECNNPRG